MTVLKTGEWLKQELKNQNMTQKELAEKAGLSIPCIAKIISGERIGSIDSWNKIDKALNTMSISYDSEKIIYDITNDILDYGNDAQCLVYYQERNGLIIFVDYLLMDEVAEFGNDEDLKKSSSIKITLKEALELFEKQDTI